MDPNTGLPMAFGKQASSHNNRETFRPPASDAGFSRGRGRGRGGVSGSERGRGGLGGRGRPRDNGFQARKPQEAAVSTSEVQENRTDAVTSSTEKAGFNPGVKRPRNQHDRESAKTGYFKESFCEDPWKPIMEAGRLGRV